MRGGINKNQYGLGSCHFKDRAKLSYYNIMKISQSFSSETVNSVYCLKET